MPDKLRNKIGGFFPMDEVGNILNPTDIDLVPDALLPIIDEIVRLYQENEGDNLHSLWLRGSVPRGFFSEKYSDIDVFALVKTPSIRWKKASWAQDAEFNLRKKFSDFPDIEWAVSSWYSDFYQNNYRLAFYLKTQSLLLFGEDIRPSLPHFKISDDIKMNLTWLKDDVADFMSIDKPLRSEIHTILKVVIRSAFESIMEKEGRYTPDLYYCAEAFGRHCQGGKELIHELLRAIEIENNNIFYLKENIGKVHNLII